MAGLRRFQRDADVFPRQINGTGQAIVDVAKRYFSVRHSKALLKLGLDASVHPLIIAKIDDASVAKLPPDIEVDMLRRMDEATNSCIEDIKTKVYNLIE